MQMEDHEDEELLGTELQTFDEDEIAQQQPARARPGKEGAASCLLSPPALLVALAADALAAVVLWGLVADGVMQPGGQA